MAQSVLTGWQGSSVSVCLMNKQITFETIDPRSVSEIS
jgi:hypothetical protein